ncbi:MAG TPA: phosphate ABC transporter substrate-binding protein PstS [Streptosporangiaceae bacterium]|nr:phosphate ABC transporter substrate-binding protein PstS [Streptosporangiaceae bacterium]
MTNRTRLATAAALVPLAVLAAACSSNSTNSGSSTSSTTTSAKMVGPALPSSPSKTPEVVTETGSTLLFPLFGTWAAAYQKQFVNSSGDPITTITTGPTGSGIGISDAASGTVDIGASDAYLSSADMSQYPGLLNIALAISAQQINYNLPGVKHLNMSGPVLAEIYSGKITNWDDPAIKKINPGVSLPNLKIIPLHRADGSGDTFLFTTYLNASDPSVWSSSNVNTTVNWPSVSGALAETGNSGMVAGCAANKGCIAYIGISYLSKTQSAGLGTASLENKAGKFVQPTSATISAEANSFTANTPANEAISMEYGPASDGYPIINYEYAIVKTSQSNGDVAEDIRAILHWAVTTGQSGSDYLDAVNFQPLPASVVAKSDALISKIGS